MAARTTFTAGRTVWLAGLLLILFAILGTMIHLREKLAIQDSVKELESQVKAANSQDQFTFFHTLPDIKMDMGRARKIHLSPGIAQASQSGGRYTIQVAALRMRNEAEKIMQSLRARGYSAYLTTGDSEDRNTSWYRIRIGGFSDRLEAERQLQSLSEKAGFHGFVIAATQ